MIRLLKKPSAWIPLAMSAAAFGLVLGYVMLSVGIPEDPQADEGAAARIFQLLLAGQVPIVAFFAVRWLPQARKEALVVLAAQILAALAAFGLVVVLEM